MKRANGKKPARKLSNSDDSQIDIACLFSNCSPQQVGRFFWIMSNVTCISCLFTVITSVCSRIIYILYSSWIFPKVLRPLIMDYSYRVRTAIVIKIPENMEWHFRIIHCSNHYPFIEKHKKLWGVLLLRVTLHSSFSQTIRKCKLWHFRLYYMKTKKFQWQNVTPSGNRTRTSHSLWLQVSHSLWLQVHYPFYTNLTFACKTETLGSLYSHALLIPFNSI